MKKVWKSMDYSLLLPLVILCVLGVIMVYSSSSIAAISRHNFYWQITFLKTINNFSYWNGIVSNCSLVTL